MPYRLHQRATSSPTIKACNPERGVVTICRSLSVSTITSPVQATGNIDCSYGNESDQSLGKASAAPSLIYAGVSLSSSTINDVGHGLGRRRKIRRTCVLEC